SENLNGIKLADRDSESYDLTALLSWELDLWGGIRRSNQAARARLLESEHRQNAVKTSLIADVANAYIDLENLDERLAISKRTAESRKASLDLVVARRDGGISSNLEVGQAEALLGEAQIAIPITEKSIAAKENEIRALLGEFPGGIARSGSLDGLDTSLSVTSGLPSSLLERRPDIAAANQAFQAATAEIGVAQALRLPSLSLTGSGGFASADLTTLLEGGSGNFIVGPSLSGPIFDAGRAKFGVKAAQARAGEALASYEKVSKQAFREAADAIDAHRKAGEIIRTRSSLVESLKQVSVVAKDRFEGGASDYLEVLDAERSLFNGELQYADDRRDRLKAVVLAYRALGGGWK
ncbi:MAG: efflux transporter outer membrane subunit, partial [Akkermansiaceae bacterium]|nr:efflux transporter outer membrane subunit [Akkermansiaceae bacterium]